MLLWYARIQNCSIYLCIFNVNSSSGITFYIKVMQKISNFKLHIKYLDYKFIRTRMLALVWLDMSDVIHGNISAVHNLVQAVTSLHLHQIEKSEQLNLAITNNRFFRSENIMIFFQCTKELFKKDGKNTKRVVKKNIILLRYRARRTIRISCISGSDSQERSAIGYRYPIFFLIFLCWGIG